MCEYEEKDESKEIGYKVDLRDPKEKIKQRRNIMRKLVLLFYVLFTIALSHSILFSSINSRVQGQVIDKDTGKPIVGASITLYDSDIGLKKFLEWNTTTDKKGHFRIDLETGPFSQYYVHCSKDGYIPFLPEYYRKNIKREYTEEVFRLFTLDEGQIKHLKIELSRGGSLSATFYVKEDSNTIPLKNAGVFIRRVKKSNDNIFNDTKHFDIDYVEVDVNGKVKYEGLEASEDYYIKLSPDGFWSQTIENISIENNITKTIEYTIDFSGKATVKGTFTVNGKPVFDGSVSLTTLEKDKFDSYNFCVFPLKDKINYYLKAIPPGKYRMDFSGTTTGNIYREKEMIIELKAGENRVIDFDLK
jgi:hypothetical protein